MKDCPSGAFKKNKNVFNIFSEGICDVRECFARLPPDFCPSVDRPVHLSTHLASMERFCTSYL